VVARFAAMWGMPLRIATAAMVVDITIGIITKVIFIVAFSILLVAATGRTDLTRPALVAVLTGTLAVAGFYAVQRMGIFRWSATLASHLAPIRWCKAAKRLIRRFDFFIAGAAELQGVPYSGRCRGSLLQPKFGSRCGRSGCHRASSQR
jgi:hypothetical protein